VNFRPRRLDPPDLNLTPLIDVVFLLLIFFMVSTTFDRETRINVTLPQADAEQAEEQPKAVEVTVDADGTYYVNQEEVVNTRIETLKRAMGKVARGDKQLPVVINADAKTPHQSVITIMDAARQLGLLHITFAARQPDGGR